MKTLNDLPVLCTAIELIAERCVQRDDVRNAVIEAARKLDLTTLAAEGELNASNAELEAMSPGDFAHFVAGDVVNASAQLYELVGLIFVTVHNALTRFFTVERVVRDGAETFDIVAPDGRRALLPIGTTRAQADRTCEQCNAMLDLIGRALYIGQSTAIH